MSDMRATRGCEEILKSVVYGTILSDFYVLAKMQSMMKEILPHVIYLGHEIIKFMKT